MNVPETLIGSRIWPRLFNQRNLTNSDSHNWSTRLSYSQQIAGHRLRGSHSKKQHNGSGCRSEIFISKMFRLRGMFHPTVISRSRTGGEIVKPSTFICSSFDLLKKATLEDVEHFLVVATLTMGED